MTLEQLRLLGARLDAAVQREDRRSRGLAVLIFAAFFGPWLFIDTHHGRAVQVTAVLLYVAWWTWRLRHRLRRLFHAGRDRVAGSPKQVASDNRR